MNIRRFETKDTAAVVQLANDYAGFDAPISEADLAISKALPDGLIVAEEHGHIVGLVFGHLRDIPTNVLEHWGASSVGHVELLAVDPNYRNRGIGTTLVEDLFRAFKRAGADFVTLHCPAEAKEAKRVYDGLGFHVRAYEMGKKL
jgi:ribosomal protein S18 acetylase RimI-like enzyme